MIALLLLACTGEAPDTASCDDLALEIPSGRGEMSGAWDGARKRLVMFGGNQAVPIECQPGATDFVGETWSYDTTCQAFIRLDPAEAPKARGRAAAATDGSRLLLHGGRFRRGDSGDYTLFDDLWAFDYGTDTWSKLPGARGPSARANHAAEVIDGRLIVFGGNTSDNGAVYTPQSDTWAYDLASASWEELSTTNAPAPRLFHATATDGQKLYVFGGGDEDVLFGGGMFNDLWSLDVASGAWTELSDGAGKAPSARIWANMAFDASGGRLLLFAGHDDGALGNNNELWAFDLSGSKWSRLREGDVYNAPANDVCDFPADFTLIEPESPERREAAISAWTGSELMIFGGKSDCGNLNDVWSYNPATETWTERYTATEGEVCLRSDTDCASMCF